MAGESWMFERGLMRSSGLSVGEARRDVISTGVLILLLWVFFWRCMMGSWKDLIFFGLDFFL